jgi:GH15 family glucan-1,4-alpha-glucosidase
MHFLEEHWREPDSGLWEGRGPKHAYTFSRVMTWVAADRTVKAIERFGLKGPLERFRQLRNTIHEEICRHAFDHDRNTFVQYAGGETLDAALLMIPLVGFLPAEDPRVIGTVDAIQRELTIDGFVRRYQTGNGGDGFKEEEGVFLACSFWLVDNLALIGRKDEARSLFERLLEIRNDVGLLAEEYDPVRRRQLGNFPQAYSHVGLINSAFNLGSDSVSSGKTSGYHRATADKP